MSISNALRYKKSYIDDIDRSIMTFVEWEGYDSRYPALEPLRLSRGEVDELRYASESLYRVFKRAVKVFQACPDKFFDDIGVPVRLRPYLNIPNDLNEPVFLSRFDYIRDVNGNIKMVEINADTPCAVVESFYANEVAAKYYKEENPNAGKREQLKQFLSDMYYAMGMLMMDGMTGDISHAKPFVFACFDDYVEDKATTIYLMNAMKEAVGSQWPLSKIKDSMVFCSFYDLMVDDDGILLPDGRHAGAIYRLHPLEILIDEQSPDGFELGNAFMEAYKAGKFKMFNPPESIIMQCKAFQALIWALHERSDFFTREENSIIEKYMIPSFFDEEAFFLNGSEDECYVRKPVWGREGCGISIVKPCRYTEGENDVMELELQYEKEVPNEDEVVQAESNAYLYQKFVESSPVHIEVDEGRCEGYLTLSCFMLGDTPSAVYGRFSADVIAGTEAFWTPILYK